MILIQVLLLPVLLLYGIASSENFSIGNVRVDLDSKSRLIIHLLDHGLYTVRNGMLIMITGFQRYNLQELPEEFRVNYTNLWMSIIGADVKEMQKNSEKLGIGELYGLFACMVSGRSWNAILGGIDKQCKTAVEANEIKNDASRYVVSVQGLSM